MKIKYCCILLYCLLFGSPAYSQAGMQPNIIFIVVDDLNDYVDGFGPLPIVSTPNIARISALGTSFSSAYCSSPLCCPSRTSFLTGKDPGYTQIYSAADYRCNTFSQNFSLEKNNDTYYTIPGYLKDSAGYYTFGINKIFHCYENFQEYDSNTIDNCAKKLSWNEYFVYNDSAVFTPENGVIDEGVYNNEWAPINDTLEPYMMDYVAIDKSISFIDNFANNEGTCGKPFFLALGIKKPHKPLFIPEKYFATEYVDDFASGTLNLPFNFPFNSYPYNGIIMPPQPEIPFSDYYNLPTLGLAQEMVKGSDENFIEWADGLNHIPVINENYETSLTIDLLAWSKRANCVMAYAAGIQYVDAQIGRLLDALEQNSTVYENTIIILIGDNGYSLGEKKHWGKRALWETDILVPFIVADLRNPTSQISNTTVNLLDVFPTICALAGIPEPQFANGTRYLDGKSLSDFMVNAELEVERPVLSSVKKETGTEGSCFPQFSVRNNRFHYIYYTSNGGVNGFCDSTNSTHEIEFYDIGRNHETDPYEWNNLGNDSNYLPAINYLSQWLPDSSMYLKSAYLVSIISSDTACYINKNEPIQFFCSVKDTIGVSVDALNDVLYRWTNNITSDTLYGDSITLDIVASASKITPANPLIIYLQLINPVDKSIIGFDMKKIAIDEPGAPEIGFNYAINNNNELVITNLTFSKQVTRWWWVINGDSILLNTMPNPYRIINDESFELVCIAEYGNNNCLASKSTWVNPTHANAPASTFYCFPNPASNQTFLMAINGVLSGKLCLYTTTGVLIQQYNLDKPYSNVFPISLEGISNGTYFLTLKTNTHIQSTKLIVMK